MTTTAARGESVRLAMQPVLGQGMVRRILLVCGIAASLAYVTADIVGALWWAGYRVTSQVVSELSAVDSPSRSLVVPLFVLYGLLTVAFGLGVLGSTGQKRALRIAGGLIVGLGLVCVMGPWAPMHQRAVLAAGGGSLTDQMHIAMTIVDVVFILLIIGFGASAFDKGFRLYSILTIVALAVFGGLTTLAAPGLSANLPTPWAGVTERINIYGYLLWTIALATTLLRRRAYRAAFASRPMLIEGHVSPGFESVRDAFVENFTQRQELGGACCVYHHGECVVDLWGGIRNKATGEPWQVDTMVLVYSATKGLSAMAMAVANSRGWLDYDERVATYWPEFAQEGKGTITVRQLLAHQAGLFAINEPVDRAMVADLDTLAVVLARQKPEWKAGARQAYHAISLGFYENELIRRIDPRHRTLGEFLQDEIASPLGLDFYVRLPEWIPNSRLATLAAPSIVATLFGLPFRVSLAALNPRSNIHRALVVNPGSEIVRDKDTIYARNLEVPSGGGVGTARSIAHAYSVFATGGGELHLEQGTMNALMAPAIPAEHGFYDECMKGDVKYLLGFMKTNSLVSFGNPGSFGAPGAGGAMGFADPLAGIGYGYVTSQMGTALTGDPRDIALRKALYTSIAKIGGVVDAHREELVDA